MKIKLETILRTKKPNTRNVENSEKNKKNPNLVQKREVTPLALLSNISFASPLFLFFLSSPLPKWDKDTIYILLIRNLKMVCLRWNSRVRIFLPAHYEKLHKLCKLLMQILCKFGGFRYFPWCCISYTGWLCRFFMLWSP